MRDYAKVDCGFWGRSEGKALIALGAEAISVWCYLTTGENSHSTGIYTIMVHQISVRLGLAVETVRGALDRMSEFDLAHYDADTEVVWVPAMIEWTYGDNLKPRDNKSVSIAKWIKHYRHSRLYQEFMGRNAHRYGLLMTVNENPSEGFENTPQGFGKASEGFQNPSEGSEGGGFGRVSEPLVSVSKPFGSIDERRAISEDRRQMSDERTRARAPGEPTTPPAWATSQTGHASPNSEDRAEAIRLLVHAGLTSHQAFTIAASKPLAAIKRQLDWLPRRQARNPVAVLIDSIMLDYEEPAWQEPASKGAA
ncbi:MAG: hypothetical protein HUU16_00015 [Candidatus Omnitrophica bacterium]|nr:hypothetical protein [bacterium]NUN94533.1 hypothetical protein [Candidatus Omnitrophota bacterium]